MTTETETRTAVFNKARNYEEFVWKNGFHPQEVVWEPRDSVEDWRDPRDPQAVGKRILGKKNVLRAADRACPPLERVLE